MFAFIVAIVFTPPLVVIILSANCEYRFAIQ